jgi:hypothetical protein
VGVSIVILGKRHPMRVLEPPSWSTLVRAQSLFALLIRPNTRESDAFGVKALICCHFLGQLKGLKKSVKACATLVCLLFVAGLKAAQYLSNSRQGAFKPMTPDEDLFEALRQTRALAMRQARICCNLQERFMMLQLP